MLSACMTAVVVKSVAWMVNDFTIDLALKWAVLTANASTTVQVAKYGVQTDYVECN